jgi:hypothetical protein
VQEVGGGVSSLEAAPAEARVGLAVVDQLGLAVFTRGGERDVQLVHAVRRWVGHLPVR